MTFKKLFVIAVKYRKVVRYIHEIIMMKHAKNYCIKFFDYEGRFN